MSRRRIGSFNSHHAEATIHRDDTASPGNFLLYFFKTKLHLNFFSKDITPTGSLRRRRSRVLSEEDDGSLMDFLRSSGHDNGSRERKPSSYGSLGKQPSFFILIYSKKFTFANLKNKPLLCVCVCVDRSWARRARTGSGCKKRPDLLNIDFGEDRERPASPSPHAESKPLPADESKPRFV